MWECEVSVDIKAPIGDVYSQLKDLTRHSEFSDGLKTIEQTTPGPMVVGTEFRAQETVPARFVSYSRITALREPGLIAWQSWTPAEKPGMKVDWEYRLSTSSRGTHLVQHSVWRAQSLPYAVINRLRRRANRRDSQRSLERIKATLEKVGVA